MEKKIVAIIPARGGSKRIKNKNKLEFLGKPLLAWTIESALNSSHISDVYVSSDDYDILSIAKKYGAKPINRPIELADDIIMPDASVVHAYNEIGKEYDYIVFIQPTSPFRRKDDINNAIEKIIEKGADSLLSVVPTHAFLWKQKGDFFNPVNYDYLARPRSQDNVQYKENGSIYIMKPEILLKNQNRLGGNVAIYEMEDWQNVDIDTKEDLEFAEYLFKKQSRKDAVIPRLKDVELIVYDFDGVMTDNKSLIDQDGVESVFINRSDGLAISMIKEHNVKQVIISTEVNSVVAKRAAKLGLECIHGVNNKLNVLTEYIMKNEIDLDCVIYVGNDVNDLEAMEVVGFPVAPSDAHHKVKAISKLIVKSCGGDGVIRDLWDNLKL